MLPTILSGKTALIYMYVVSTPSKSAGVREIQRAMHLASPSSALHHLNKLVEAGILAQDYEGIYVVKRRIKLGILNDFVLVRGSLVPKDLFYALAVTSILIASVWLLRDDISAAAVILALMPNVASAAIFWYETVAAWKFRNIFR